MSIDKILTYDTELTDDIGYTVHPINLALGESLGHTVKVNVYRNGTKITDSASCKAKFLRSDGSTVEINGTFASGVASVTLPSSCYTVEGAAKLSVSLVSGSTISTVFIMICNVNRYSTTAIVDSNQVVPNIETLLANVDKLETLIGEAEGLSLNKVGYAEASGNVLTLYSDNTKKKVVSSVILPSGNSYDDTEIREQLADLNNDLSTLSESITEISEDRLLFIETSTFTTKYAKVSTLKHGKKYRLNFHVSSDVSAGNVKAGTSNTSEDMVDIIIEPSIFKTNEDNFVDYEPTGDFTSIFASRSEVTSVDVYEVCRVSETSKKVDILELNVSSMNEDVEQHSSDIQNLNESFIERTEQLFDISTAKIFTGFTNSSQMKITNSSTCRMVSIPVSVTNETAITVHKDFVTSRFGVGRSNEENANIGSILTGVENSNSSTQITIPVEPSTKSIVVLFWHTDTTDHTEEEVLKTIMVQFGKQFTGYKPFYEKVDFNDFVRKGEEVSNILPPYASDEIYDVSERVEEVNKNKTSSFLFITDSHIKSVKKDTISWVDVRMFDIINEMVKSCPVTMCVHGGDLIDGSVAKLNSVDEIKTVMKKANECIVPFYFIKGNHDDNNLHTTGGDRTIHYNIPQNDYITPLEFYNRTSRFTEKKQNVTLGNKDGAYWYVDDNVNKIRYIMLNSNDHPQSTTGGNMDYYDLANCSFMNEQINWFAHTALNFADKIDKTEWSVLVIQHIADSGVTMRNFKGITTALTGFVNGTHVTKSERTYYGGYDLDVDFTSQGAMEFIAFVVGDKHTDTTEVIDGHLVIRTTCARHYEHGYNDTVDTRLESAFDIYTIDKDSKKVMTTRFGDGSDRVFDYRNKVQIS